MKKAMFVVLILMVTFICRRSVDTGEYELTPIIIIDSGGSTNRTFPILSELDWDWNDTDEWTAHGYNGRVEK